MNTIIKDLFETKKFATIEKLVCSGELSLDELPEDFFIIFKNWIECPSNSHELLKKERPSTE